MVLEVNERKLNILKLTVCSSTNRGFEEANRRNSISKHTCTVS